VTEYAQTFKREDWIDRPVVPSFSRTLRTANEYANLAFKLLNKTALMPLVVVVDGENHHVIVSVECVTLAASVAAVQLLHEYWLWELEPVGQITEFAVVVPKEPVVTPYV
jgi:hypothetical protein